MFFRNALPGLFGALGLALTCSAHPGGLPRLMGRDGNSIDVRQLPDMSNLIKRAPTPDETCGSANGYTCNTNANVCCSQYGSTSTTTATTTPSASTGTPSTNGRCGSGTAGGNQVCANDGCCSPAGYCGSTKDHCASPDCLVGWGRCDADITPSGSTTSNVARTQWGNIPYDAGFYACNTIGEIAITYDDGPDIYTAAMMDVLDKYNAKATFFITGVNNGKGAIDDATTAWPAVIRRMRDDGHQLASHTWSHANLSTLTEDRRRDEMVKLEMALRNIIGYFPTYMRPPYSSCDAACVATMQSLGYHIAFFDLDTDDYNNATPLLIQNSKDVFQAALAGSNSASKSWLAIAHDINQQTALNLTEFMLKELTQKGYQAVSLGKCLDDPQENWYRKMDGSGGLPLVS